MSENWEDTRNDHRSRQAASIAGSALSLLAEQGGSALSMAAIAERAEISRQTLYRYYNDVEAVLVGVAELVTAHDAAFAELVSRQPDPRSQLELIAAAATSGGHGEQNLTSLLAVLPPSGRVVVAQHQARATALLAEVLQSGVDQGVFRQDLRPQSDAPLILGLLDAAEPNAPARAISLAFELVESNNPRSQRDD